MAEIIRLSKATGVQLRQAAHHRDLINEPNMPFGFANAYWASVPSPMQEQILRKALQSVGANYLKVEEQVTIASEADKFPDVMQVALKQLIRATKAQMEADAQVEIKVAGHVLYASVMTEGMDPVRTVKAVVKGKGFVRQNDRTWIKVVKMKRKSFVACVDAAGSTVELSVFRGA